MPSVLLVLLAAGPASFHSQWCSTCAHCTCRLVTDTTSQHARRSQQKAHMQTQTSVATVTVTEIFFVCVSPILHQILVAICAVPSDLQSNLRTVGHQHRCTWQHGPTCQHGHVLRQCFSLQRLIWPRSVRLLLPSGNLTAMSWHA